MPLAGCCRWGADEGVGAPPQDGQVPMQKMRTHQQGLWLLMRRYRCDPRQRTASGAALFCGQPSSAFLVGVECAGSTSALLPALLLFCLSAGSL